MLLRKVCSMKGLLLVIDGVALISLGMVLQMAPPFPVSMLLLLIIFVLMQFLSLSKNPSSAFLCNVAAVGLILLSAQRWRTLKAMLLTKNRTVTEKRLTNNLFGRYS